MKKKTLGIITARGGSKGIPRKNIKLLGGKPLIAHTIEAAKESGIFDRVILSTDDAEIAEIGKQYGAEVPFMRPEELAQDKTPTLPVLIHALEWLKTNEGYEPEAVAILQPTSPLRRPEHLKDAHELFVQSGADSVVSMKEVPGHHNPHWQFRVGDDGRIEIFTGESFVDIVKRRQDLPKTHTRNGAIYLFKTGLLFEDPPSFYGRDVRAYVMDERSSVNIDEPADFERAEEYLRPID
ncbi:MAG: acylneuraminate cytidylyltransferase family protein [Minisyncoccia bacterium]